MGEGYRVRLDPWAADYQGAIRLVEPGEDEAAEVDLEIETGDWRGVRPPPAPLPDRAWFVDGVRRIEHRLLLERDEGDRTVFGLLASFAVGATEVTDAARVGQERVRRVACVGSGLRIAPFEAPLTGGACLTFEPETVAEDTPVAPVQGLQDAMRRSEAELAQSLANQADAVFLDGPLTFLTTAGPVVGYVKRLLRTYLPPGPAALLRSLGVGERTPVFLIKGAQPRYSWYARVGTGRLIDASLTGVVRLEATGRLDLREVLALADVTARYLPRFASDPAHDPRAPQNLHPIGGLEAHLRHRLGDATVVRRAIESALHAEALA
jgi:hypothetical protein